ncbi:hypothetical protein BDV96DRAFT_617892 [Lophiotrema nucula]|uniref:Uncharacterized protein n=1 Tax=Lophiotrema nucula TaxID=690887 RepID=A0A6A5YDR3_9PLEO|nr:hypothetical protein BDV96DRAFT_617892 [Lophiotrema nucula]
MNKSNATYNGLPRISSDMHVSQYHIKNLLAIPAKHGLREKIGIHLLHKHDDIPKEQVKLETKLKTKPGKWTKPIPIDSLDLKNIHPVVLKFVLESVTGELRLHLDPYEFGDGPSPVSPCDVDDNNCIKEVADYITRNNLVDVIALEFLHSVKDAQPRECTAEVEVGKYGTIVLPKPMMKSGKLIPTSWPNTSQPFDPDGQPDPGTHWVEAKVKDKVTHKVFVDQIENETDLLDELVRQGIIRV